jgi:hypothetical protein
VKVTGYSFGQSWTAVHTEFIEPASIEDAMVAVSDDIVYLAGQGRIYRTITLDIEED